MIRQYGYFTLLMKSEDGGSHNFLLLGLLALEIYFLQEEILQFQLASNVLQKAEDLA